jgi:hypothetical protein
MVHCNFVHQRDHTPPWHVVAEQQRAARAAEQQRKARAAAALWDQAAPVVRDART